MRDTTPRKYDSLLILDRQSNASEGGSGRLYAPQDWRDRLLIPIWRILKCDCNCRQNKSMRRSMVFVKYNDMRGWMNLPGKGGATHFEPCISPIASDRPPTELCVACSSRRFTSSIISRDAQKHPLFPSPINDYLTIPLGG
jgi:hypothetical protein